MFKRTRSADDFAEEIKSHLELEADELKREGLSEDEARRRARVEFGSVPAAQERFYLRNRVVWLDNLVRDLKFASRQLVRNPVFAIAAILVLALGIGVSVAIFGFVNAALLKPLPYPNPTRLMSVNENAVAWPRSPLSTPDYLDWKRLNHSFSSLDVYHETGYLLRSSSGAEPVPAGRVSDGFFGTLGIRPMLGRDFLPGEDRPGGPRFAILSYGTWLKRFGRSRNILGQSVDLSGDAYTIIGVLPREFTFAPQGNTEFWVPLGKLNHCEQQRGCHNLWGIGRLRDGVTVEAARAEMKGIAKQLEQQYPISNRDQGATVVPFSQIVLGDVRPVLLTLFGGAGLLLLIACVNVASLLLVRSESRKHEVAVRSALGATPARLTGQFVTEGLLLTVLGSIAGVLVAAGLMRLLTRLVPKDMAAGMPFLSSVGLDARTAAFAAAVALLAALLLAATPALRLSFQDLREGLTEAGRTSDGRFWSRIGANLVVAELAIAVVLLAGAGLLGKSFYRLLHAPMNFDSGHLAIVEIETPQNAYSKDTQLVSLYQEIVRRVSALPGVQSAGLVSDPPVLCNCDTDWLRFVGKPFHGEHNEVNQRMISPGYLSTLKASLIRGRLFTDADNASHPNVILINQALARKYFPGEDPIGKKVGNDELAPDSIREIIGVVGNVREGSLDTDVWPAEYQPIYQSQSPEFTLVVRASNDEAALLPALVKAIHEIDPNLGVRDEETMTEHIQATQTALLHRFSTWLVGGFAAMALVLGIVGLYGVIAYSVSQRTREIGIRMALGAQRPSVYTLIMRQAGWLTATGLVIGLACSIGASLLIRDLLFGVQAWDAATLASVAVVLGLVSMAASFVPAHRAASVNPVEALRSE